jgi:hypothetical protein
MKSETPNSSLGFKSGINYFFIFGSDSETIHVKSQYSTSYRFTNQFLEENPSLYSDPSIIPRFQFSIYTIKNKFPSVEIELPNPKSKPSKKKESSVENWILQLNPIIQNEFKLERCFRESRIATRYLSLRDIVNPESTIEQILDKIENLNFNSHEKSNLYRLVKILFAGNSNEEKTILSNIFSNDIEFGNFLQNRIFSIEILPLIHGPFLNEILSKLDERLIRNSLVNLSPQVLICLENSLSKNKWKQIINGHYLEKPAEESLAQIIERNIFQKFSRKLYYNSGTYTIYKIPDTISDYNFIESYISKNTTDLLFYTSQNSISLYSKTNKEIFLITHDWIDTIRIDLIFSSREIKTFEYFLLPPKYLLKIPFLAGQYAIGSAILRNRSCLEFSIQPNTI